MQLLTLGRDPAITASFISQLASARPGQYAAHTAHSPAEFRALARAHRDAIDAVLLGAAQTDEQVKVACAVVVEVWGAATLEEEDERGELVRKDFGEHVRAGEDAAPARPRMRVVRFPRRLLTEEGVRGGLVAWFLELAEGDGANAE